MTWIEQSQFRGEWKQAKPKFSKGKYVIFDGQIYLVTAATHTHLQLQGLKYAVAEWQCQPYKCQSSTYTPKDLVPKSELKLSTSTSSTENPELLRSPKYSIPTAGEDLIGRKP